MMRAAVINRWGGSDVFCVVENHPKPVLSSPLDVLLRVKACAITPTDIIAREGVVFCDLVRLPTIVGYHVSGVIEETGSAVRDFAVGDEVAALLPLDTPCGGYAEYCIVNAYELVRKAEGISHEEAAVCLGAGIRSYTALHYLMRLRQDDAVYICSGASSFGHIALQVARLYDARVITSASSSEEIDFLIGLFPDKSLTIIDTRTEDLVEALLQATDGLGCDAILDDEDIYFCRSVARLRAPLPSASPVPSHSPSPPPAARLPSGVYASSSRMAQDTASSRQAPGVASLNTSTSNSRIRAASLGSMPMNVPKPRSPVEQTLNASSSKSAVSHLSINSYDTSRSRKPSPPDPRSKSPEDVAAERDKGTVSPTNLMPSSGNRSLKNRIPAPIPQKPLATRTLPGATTAPRRQQRANSVEEAESHPPLERALTSSIETARDRISRHARHTRLIQSLAVHGKLVTTSPGLELDSVNSRELFLRNACVGFLFEYAWPLGGTFRGRYLHILMEVMERIAQHELQARVRRTFGLDDVAAAHAALLDGPGAVVLLL